MPRSKGIDKLLTKIRKCLKCQKEFPSVGFRICPRCTEKNLRVGRIIDNGVLKYDPREGARNVDAYVS